MGVRGVTGKAGVEGVVSTDDEGVDQRLEEKMGVVGRADADDGRADRFDEVVETRDSVRVKGISSGSNTVVMGVGSIGPSLEPGR